MKAKVLVGVAGAERTFLPGDIVTGDDAVDLVSAGYAIPIRDDGGQAQIEHATAKRKILPK